MFLDDVISGASFSQYLEKRNQLIDAIKKSEKDYKNGLVLLFADFEKPDVRFRQESSFYYFTGITEPGVALIIDMEAQSRLFIPNCYKEREKWACSSLQPTPENAQKLHMNSIELLGESIRGYNIYPYFEQAAYKNFLSIIQSHAQQGGTFFVLNPNNSYEYVTQRFILERIRKFVPEMKDEALFDISHLVAQKRRAKNIFEIEKVSDAINLTIMAHEAAASAIEVGVLESEVQALAEYVFTATCATAAFPSIVAAGKNATTLHYSDNSSELLDGQLVIVDIGAEFNHYCGDLTRTYPVSGKFTGRQRELYELVLETQKYIAGIVRPGYYLFSEKHKKKSLHHLAKDFLLSKGYADYFTHGIGHFLGLNVHDVGDMREPLKDGDVITVEPGIYIPEEQIGIRIEDNYWITDEQTICLSEILPKEITEVETFMETAKSEQESSLIDT